MRKRRGGYVLTSHAALARMQWRKSFRTPSPVCFCWGKSSRWSRSCECSVSPRYQGACGVFGSVKTDRHRAFPGRVSPVFTAATSSGFGPRKKKKKNPSGHHRFTSAVSLAAELASELTPQQSCRRLASSGRSPVFSLRWLPASGKGRWGGERNREPTAAMAETKIIYHIDEEETPYLVKIPIAAENITLLDFKQVLNKPNYKFFFKSMDQDFGWAALV